MKFDVEIKSYQVKQSKTGHSIPVINGVHLHSAYNPIKEAESFVSKYDEVLNTKKNILVLGLAFGYHIDEIQFRLNRYHGNDYQITVVEPCKQTINHFRKINSKSDIRIFSNNDLEELYADADFIEVLSTKPGVIAHPASFNLYSDYFKAFMSFNADETLGGISQNINSGMFAQLFEDFPNTYTTEDVIGQIKNKQSGNFTREEYLLMAFDHLIQRGKATTTTSI